MSVQTPDTMEISTEDTQLVEQKYWVMYDFVPDEAKVNIAGEALTEKEAIRWRLGGSTRGYYMRTRMIPYIPMCADFDDVQKAFVEGRISLEDFIQILVDNFGQKKAKKILKHNLKLAKKDDRERALNDNI